MIRKGAVKPGFLFSKRINEFSYLLNIRGTVGFDRLSQRRLPCPEPVEGIAVRLR
jgi:hypothetical protein